MRIALKIASRATPESAKTASHSVATPTVPNARMANFTTKANVTFCQMMRRVYLPILTAVTSFDKLSS